jgi:hypothetical protein
MVGNADNLQWEDEDRRRTTGAPTELDECNPVWLRSHPGLNAACIGVAALEIRKITDPQRRAEITRNAAEALKETVNG